MKSDYGWRRGISLVYAFVTQRTTEMEMIARWLCILLLALVPNAAFADYELQFIRTTCVPEAGYMRIEYTDIPSMMTTADPSESPLMQRKFAAAWARRGLHSPRKMAVDCKISDHAFHISADQDKSGSGMCMAYPQISLQITRDGQPWLEAVTGGQECDSGSTASIGSIEVGQGAVKICVSANAGGDARCSFIWPAQQDIFPLYQADIEAVVAEPVTSDASESAWQTAIKRNREARMLPASKAD
jgi:hypothetical protein